MVLMKYFCFFFPVRLGVIITSVFNAVQCLVQISFALAYDAEFLKGKITETIDKIDEYSSNEYFDQFLEYAEKCEWLKISCTFFINFF